MQNVLNSRVFRRVIFFCLAALIGAVVGLSTLALIKLVSMVQWIGYGDASEIRFTQIIAARPAWQVVLVPAMGGLAVGVLMQYLPGRRYHGISDVMEACALNNARMSARSGIGSGLASAISLGVGAPLGREGPAVHIGASISAWLAEKLDLDHRQSVALLGCGAAAAVAVSFNTPIAAVIFALEVVVGYYTLRVFAPIVIAVMLAMLVRGFFVSDQALYLIPPHNIFSNWELLSFGLLGIVGALVANSLLITTQFFQQLWNVSRVPRWFRPALAGAAIGFVAIPFPNMLSLGIDNLPTYEGLPQVMGIGFESTLLALRGALDNDLLLSLMIAKFLLVALALSSGFAGGIFGPAVFLGAMLGGLFWVVAQSTGISISDQGVYATIGMAAVGSALLGAPISTILIVFELTRDYGITLGVMTAAACASAVMQLGRHASFFRWQLARRNINLSHGRDISILMTHRVKNLITHQYLVVDQGLTTGELESRMGRERKHLAVFIDDNGVFEGSVSLSSLISHAIEHGMNTAAFDAANGSGYSITPTTNIVTAVQNMAEQQQDYVPVVEYNCEDGYTVLGIVTKSDLLAEHYEAVKRAREDEFGIT